MIVKILSIFFNKKYKNFNKIYYKKNNNIFNVIFTILNKI